MENAVRNLFFEGLGAADPEPTAPETVETQPAAPAPEPQEDPAPRTTRYERAENTGAMKEQFAAGKDCFGGRLFRYRDKNGRDYAAFAVKEESNSAAADRERHYEELDDLRLDGGLGLLEFHRRVTMDNFAVYLYRLPKSARSLEEAMPVQAEVVLQELVELLNTYQSFFSEAEYVPLRSISPGTVFLDANQKVYLLPISYRTEHMPPEVPRDPYPSVATDIFSVCYLVTKLENGHLEDNVGYARPSHELVLEGIAVFPDWRPSLASLVSAFGRSSYTPPKPTARRPASGPAGNRPRQPAEPREVPAGAMVGRFLGQVGDIFSKLREETQAVESRQDTDTTFKGQ